MYQIATTEFGQMIFRTTDYAWIPFSESNADYQDYLGWVAEGNTAEEWSPEDGN
jgi:hypothetical protein